MHQSNNLRRLKFVAMALLCVSIAPAVQAQQWGDLKIQFVYDGDPPKQEPIQPNKDVQYCGMHDLVEQSLVVDPKTKGIKNVVVYAYTDGRGATPLPAIKPELQNNPKTHEMANDECRFEPRIVVMSAGDTLKVTNPDPIGHNYNFNAFNNPAVNFTLAPGAAKDLKLEKGELAPVPVECNIHPWMKGYVVVFDHPYSAKSDEQGNLEIKGLPAGTKLAFRLFHESAGRLSNLQKADGGQLELSRNVFEVQIEPGMNDLGKVLMSPKDFQ